LTFAVVITIFYGANM